MVHCVQSLLFPIRATALASGLLLLAGCGGGGSNNDDDGGGDQTKNVMVEFEAEVNGQAFVCGQTYSNVGSGLPGTYKVTDWRFYVHDLELVRADGSREPVILDQDGVWQYQNLAMLDLENGCSGGTTQTNAVVKGTVLDDNYTGICFKLGIPYELNHLNDATAPSPLNSTGMLWNWRAGRKFIRVDGTGDPDNSNVAFPIHLGSTECPGSAPNAPPTATCGYPNVAEFCLTDFDVDEDHLIMDIGKVLAASNVTVNTAGTAPGCMSANSDPECIEIIPRLNLDFVYAAGGGAPPVTYPKVVPQPLFSVHQP